MPFGVPNAIVEICTLAARAAAIADGIVRPVVFEPSLSSTMRAGGGLSPLAVVACAKTRIASSEVKIASPIAV